MPGIPVTKPQELKGLLALGGPEESSGYKGYGLAMMVEILCGILSGIDCIAVRCARVIDVLRVKGVISARGYVRGSPARPPKLISDNVSWRSILRRLRTISKDAFRS